MPSALQPVQHIPFLPGIREDVDPTSAPPGMLRDAQNVRFGRAGAVYPRRGTKAVSRNSQNSNLTSSMTPGGTGTFTRTRSPYLLAGGLTWLRDETTEWFTSMGAHSTVVPYRQLGAVVDPGTVGATYGTRKYGVAINSLGYTCLAAATVGYLFQIFSPDGQIVFEQRTATATVIAASVVAVGGTFVCVYQDGVTLSAFVISNAGSAVSSISFGSTATVGTLVNSNADTGWDIAPASNGTQWYLAFQNAAATLRMDLFTGTTSAANNTQAVTAADTPCSIYADSSRVWLGWYDAPATVGSVRHRTFNISTLVAIDAALTLETAIATGGPPLIGPAVSGNGVSATAFAVWRTSQGSTSNYLTGCRYRHIAGTGLVGTQHTLWHHHPISKPDSSSRVWTVTGNQAPNCKFQRAILMTLYKEGSDSFSANEPMIACARPTTGIANGTGTGSAQPSALSLKTMFGAIAELNGRNLFAVPEVLRTGSGTTNNSLLQLALLEVRTDTAEPIRHCFGDGETLIVNGQPREFPGRIAPGGGTQLVKGGFETGFAYAPIVLTATQGGGGSLTSTGVYSWIFVFEWVDGLGRLQQGPPSVPYNLTLTGVNNSVTFTVTSLDGSDRQASGSIGDARLVAYRTQNNIPGVYLLETMPTASVSARDGTGAVTSVSSASDATIGAVAIPLYVSSGQKDNTLAPAARFGCQSEDRIHLGGGFNPYLSTASKQIFPGNAIAFSDSEAFQIAWPEPLFGMAYQDGSVIGFAETSIYVSGGEGPDDQGNGQFFTPRAICRDIGCVDWRTIVETARGIFFRSARGFYLLPRGNGAPIFVGAGVQRTFASTAFPTCFGAAVFCCSEHRTVRWLLSDGSTNTRVAIYDLDASETDPQAGWSYDTYTDQLAAIGPWPSGLALIDASFSSSTRIGYLEQATPAFLGDGSNGQAITSAIETCDIRSAGPAGWFKLQTATCLMSASDGGTVTITVTPDGDGQTALSEARSMPVVTGSLYQFAAPAFNNCSAVKLRYSCVRTTSTRGPTFHALTLEQNQVGGARRTTTAERT